MKNMNGSQFFVEAPSKDGNDVELFVQTNAAHSLACLSHVHNVVELLYILEGRYSILADGVEYEGKRGDLVLFCSNSIHSAYTKDLPKNSYCVIKVPPTLFLSLAERDRGAGYLACFALCRKGQRIFWTADDMSPTMRRVLCSLMEEYANDHYAKDVGIRIRIMELLLTILREYPVTYVESMGQTAEPIYRAMAYVHEHYAEEIDERALAESVGLSYGYFSRSFKRITGRSFSRHLMLTRIHRAEELLCDGNRSISEVALCCGFNSISYFSSVFKKIKGETPRAACGAIAKESNAD